MQLSTVQMAVVLVVGIFSGVYIFKPHFKQLQTSAQPDLNKEEPPSGKEGFNTEKLSKSAKS